LKNKYFRFGEFRLYPTEHLLLREQTPLPLAPKAFDILLYLLRNSGHLVKRDVLMEAIWPDSFVEETNITVNISLLRKTLGSMSDGQPYIETVPRKGYRFNAAVTECEDPDQLPFSEPKSDLQKSNEDVMLPAVAAPALLGAATAPSEALISPAATTTPSTSASVHSASLRSAPALGWKTSATRVLLMSVVCVALALGFFYFWSHWRSKSATVSASERSIAILPFRPLEATPEDEYLGLGMTDALITRLSNLHKIIVRPVGAVRKYATVDDPIAAGRHLAVQSVLEGSIQRSGDRTRVTVRLLRVADGELLWGDEFDEKFTDMFTVEDSISQKVASALTINLSGDEKRQLLRPFTVNNQAYQLYMQGRFFWNKRTIDGVEKSLDYFQKAIAADPKYALAYAGLADSYTLAGSYGYSILPPREAMPKAEAAAAKALALDDSLAEAHASLGYIKFTYDWDWRGAEQEFKRAIALNPDYDNAHHWYSHELMALGRTDEAMAEARRALELSPSETVMNEHMGWTYLMSRDYDRAIQSARKAIEMDPDFLLAHRVLGLAYEYKGQHDEASAEFTHGVELSHGDPVAKAFLARSYAAAGHKDQATQILDELLRLATKRYVPPAEIAATAIALGRNDEAFSWLNKAYDERAAALVYLKVNRDYDSIRADSRFRDLLERMHLQ
jgi:DNA-binding winged helix-turn-helix (wHTH) protein/TolB-like protein/tetratricopeptide (TPR) repeat protein